MLARDSVATGCGNAFGRFLARPRALRGGVVCEATSDAHDLGYQRSKLQLDAFVCDSAPRVEDMERGGNRIT